MASTYSTNLGFELPGTGDQAGTWSITNNTNIGTLIEQAISGYVTQAITDGADTVITIPNGASGVARNMTLELTGALTAARNLIVPANRKLYFIFNNTTGSQSVTVKVSGQTGVSVPNGQKMVLVCNGTDVVTAVTYAASMSVGNLSYTGTLTGGTGIVNLGSGQFYKDASGNVGIGTASPGHRLSVNGASRLGGSVNSILIQDGTFAVGVASIAADSGARIDFGTAGANPVLFWTNNAERMRLDASGNVGIGTTPSAWRSGARALQLGANGYVSLFEQSNGTANLTFAAYESAANTFAYRTTGDAPTIYSQVGGVHTWSNAVAGTAGNTFSFTERMRLDASGNLGIGTASPAHRLHVATAGNNYIVSQRTTANTSALLLGAESGGTSIYSWTTVAGSTGVPLNFYTGASPSMTLDTSGNLGIGTASPTTRLQVDGAIRTSTSITGPLGFFFTSATNPASSGASGNGLNLGYDNNGEVAWIQANRNSISETRPLLLNPNGGSVAAGTNAALATNATDGFLYVPTCAGVPTGAPTAVTGMVPIVVDTTNNRWYFYSGGAWRNAGP